MLGVRVRIEGGVPVGLFPGYDLRRTVREPLRDAREPTSRDLRQLLVDLGFMAPTGLAAASADELSTAVLAFEKWHGLPRDGVLDDDVTSLLLRSARPQPTVRRPGRRVEILLRRQVSLQIVDGRVERVFHISSGAGGADAEWVLPRVPEGAHVVVGAVLDLDAVGELLHRWDRNARVLASADVSRLARLRPHDGARRAADVRVRHARDARGRGLGARVRRLQGVPLLVALLVGVGLVPAVVRADTTPPPVAAPTPPRSLVVGLSLGNPRLQAGVVRGRDVILARGFEVELARILARRLGGRVEGFVYVPSAPRLLASAFAGWHLAVGGIRAVGGRSAAGDATRRYLTTDIAVVSRRGLPRLRGLADLRRVLVCAVRGSESARVASLRVRPRRSALLVAGPERLATVLRTGACDAALVPAVEAGRFVEGRKRLLGPVVGRISHGDGLRRARPSRHRARRRRSRPRARSPCAGRDARPPRTCLAADRPRRASRLTVKPEWVPG